MLAFISPLIKLLPVMLWISNQTACQTDHAAQEDVAFFSEMGLFHLPGKSNQSGQFTAAFCRAEALVKSSIPGIRKQCKMSEGERNCWQIRKCTSNVGVQVLPSQLHLQIRPGEPHERQKAPNECPSPAGRMQKHGKQLRIARSEIGSEQCATGWRGPSSNLDMQPLPS